MASSGAMAVGHGLLGGEEAIPVHVGVQFLDRPPGMAVVDLLSSSPQFEDLPCVDLDVRGLPLKARARLVDQEPGVGKGRALAHGTAHGYERARRHGDAVTDGLYVGC